MREWTLKLLSAAILVGIFSTNVEAQPLLRFNGWWKKAKSQFELDRSRNNALPQPFASQDQAAIQQSFAAMYIQGASKSRIMDSVHFDAKSNTLNNIGKTRLREILADDKPLDILLASTLDPEVDRKRTENLKSLLASYHFKGYKPGVATTFTVPHHAVGTEQSQRRESYLNAMPLPTLQSVAGQVSGSAGGQ